MTNLMQDCQNISEEEAADVKWEERKSNATGAGMLRVSRGNVDLFE